METLALIELLDHDGQPRHAVRVTAWPVRIGRAIDCDVVLDDPHVAAHHASLVWREDGVHVEPAPSVNGVRLGRATIVPGSTPALVASALLGVGTTTLRVRLAGEVLAPEQPLTPDHHGTALRTAWLAGLALIAAVWAAFNQWIVAAPDSSSTEMIGIYLAAPVGLGIWCGLWALGSKLFQRRFAFWPHFEAALFWPLAAMVAETLSGQAAFALSLPWVAKAGHIGAILALAMLLWRHLSIVLPQRRAAFAWVIVALVTVGGTLDMAERLRSQRPLVGSLYLGTLSLPGLRLAHPVSAEAFVEAAAPLEKSLARWAKASGDDAEPAPSDDD